jgi:hypothetical protein
MENRELSEKKPLKDEFVLEKDKDLPGNKDKIVISNDAYVVSLMIENFFERLNNKLDIIKRGLMLK